MRISQYQKSEISRPQQRLLPLNPKFRSAFSILEVMVAMGIFAIAFVSIAAIFPAGAFLQKQTMTAVRGKQIGESVKALLEARPFDNGTFTGAVGPALQMNTVPDAAYFWTLEDRSFPTANTAIASIPATERDYYWLPVVRRSVPASPGPIEYQVFAFILRRDKGGKWPTPAPHTNNKFANAASDPETIPSVKRLNTPTVTNNTFTVTGLPANDIHVGDQILDDWGTIYAVENVNGTVVTVSGTIIKGGLSNTPPPGIWYAPPGGPGMASPLIQIIGPLANAVKVTNLNP
ncbi:MAG: hypothetical protein WD042_07795 [Phycisphaeraceae bacterium]